MSTFRHGGVWIAPSLLLRGKLIFAVNGGDDQRLEPCALSHHFAGEDRVSGRPLGKPSFVLNIITRRDHNAASRGSAAADDCLASWKI